MKAYIGSKNVTKVNAVKEILEPLGYEVIAMDVPSGVSNQPKDDEETIKGAYNRANSLPKDGLRIGLEAGVEILNDDLFLTNYGVLIDELGNVYKAGGTRIVLPDVLKKGIFEEGLELSDCMEKYFGENNIKNRNGAIGFLTCNQVERIEIFTHIIKLLYGQYLYGVKK